MGEHLPLVYIDKNQLETALVNLIVNAKDALNHEGNIIIRSTQLTVQRAHCQEEMVQLSIIDDGCGMDEQTQNGYLNHSSPPNKMVAEVAWAYPWSMVLSASRKDVY